MVKAVLCDIDGTLIESNWLHAAAWRDAFAFIEIKLDLEEVRRQIGKGGDQLVPYFVPWWKRDFVDEPLKKYRKCIYEQDYMPKVKPFPRVRELLERMRQAGIRVALASSSKKDELDYYKRLANIDDVVEKNTSVDLADKSKPYPDIFQATLKKLDIKPAEALALGDTPYDAEAAGHAGVWTVGVTSGGWSEQELLYAGCIEVWKDVSDLLANFERSAFMRFGASD
jgi:HAD superfamily hydrolase (TIGR01509 family)